MGAEVDAGPRAWRGIDELAGLVGAYCWVEEPHLRGQRGLGDGAADDEGGALDPALRVWCAGVSRRHGLLAARWAERLPVRAGVDAGGTGACAGRAVGRGAGRHGGHGRARVGVADLVQRCCPGLRAVYGLHRAHGLARSARAPSWRSWRRPRGTWAAEIRERPRPAGGESGGADEGRRARAGR